MYCIPGMAFFQNSLDKATLSHFHWEERKKREYGSASDATAMQQRSSSPSVLKKKIVTKHAKKIFEKKISASPRPFLVRRLYPSD